MTRPGILERHEIDREGPSQFVKLGGRPEWRGARRKPFGR